MIFLSQVGKVALAEGSENPNILLFPESKAFEPIASEDDCLDTIRTMVRRRAKSYFGFTIKPQLDLIYTLPYAKHIKGRLYPDIVDRWPRAEGRVQLPIIVPSIVLTEKSDERSKFNVRWADNVGVAADMLHASCLSHGSPNTFTALQAVGTARPFIAGIMNSQPVSL
jgi:hypothetical protein